MSPPPGLASDLYGYSDYWERTGGFTSRRELPHAEGVLARMAAASWRREVRFIQSSIAAVGYDETRETTRRRP
jgi:hypothetical protein